MGSIIFVIIIIAVSLAASVKKQQQQKEKQTKQNADYSGCHNIRRKPPVAGNVGESTFYNKNTTYKSNSSSANRSSSASGSSSATRKAAERAKDNMTEQELKTRPTAQKLKEMAGVELGDGAILSAAKMHSLATELDNEFDSKEDLMGPVFDLMVAGPDTSIPNERDFISEGMDMISSYTLEG